MFKIGYRLQLLFSCDGVFRVSGNDTQLFLEIIRDCPQVRKATKYLSHSKGFINF